MQGQRQYASQEQIVLQEKPSVLQQALPMLLWQQGAFYGILTAVAQQQHQRQHDQETVQGLFCTVVEPAQRFEHPGRRQRGDGIFDVCGVRGDTVGGLSDPRAGICSGQTQGPS